jgi:hypothetical protein
VGNSVLGVDRQLLASIDLCGAFGENLADSIRRKREIGHIAHRRHTLPTPTRKVRNQDVIAKVRLGFDEQDPSARPATPALERGPKLSGERRRSRRMRTGGTRVRVQDAVNHLGDHVARSGQHIRVRGALESGIGHCVEGSLGPPRIALHVLGPRAPKVAPLTQYGLSLTVGGWLKP